MKKKELIIFGSSGTASEIIDLVRMYYSDNFDKFYVVYFDDAFRENISIKEKINNPVYQLYYVLGFADVSLRRRCVSKMAAINNIKPFTIINPTAFIADSSLIGEGVYVAGNASISSEVKLCDFSLVSFNASIGHQSIIEEYCVVLAGARVSGNVKLGAGSLVGSNAFIFQGLSIGADNLIDAMTYIKQDLPEGMLSFARNTKTIKRTDL